MAKCYERSCGVSGQLLVVSCLEDSGADCVALPGLDVDQPECGGRRQNVTNEAKFCDDVFNTENKGDIEVTADSGGDSGLDTGRTKPELEVDSSQLLVVSCLKTEAGGGDVVVVARPPEVGDGGAAGSGVGLADGDRPDLVEIERILKEMSEAEQMVEEEIEQLPPEAVEEIELLKELLAASREEGKRLREHQPRSP